MQSHLFSSLSKVSLFLPFVAGVAGIATHLLFFKRGEHHLYPVRYPQALALIFVTSVVALTHYGAHPWKESVSLSSPIFGYFLAGIYASLTAYRLFFNPLNKFPGPYFARLSAFDLVFRVSKFDANKHLYRLHQKHGKFVRIGPNELSITEPEGMQIINGATSKCRKATW
jgi:tryprostatin B 6-hydroxylase